MDWMKLTIMPLRSAAVSVRAALGRMARAVGLGDIRIDEPRSRGQVVRLQHLFRRHLHVPCVGHVGVDVGEGQLHGLDHQVLRFRMIDGARGQVEMLQDAKRDQRRDALPVRRNLVQRVAAIGLADGRNPFRRVVPQVRQGQRGLVRLRVATSLWAVSPS